MKSHGIEAIFWDDHYVANRQDLPNSSDDFFDVPTLSVGIVLDETEKSLLLASSIEPPQGANEVTYLVILKSAIVGRKKYGEIELRNLK